MSYLRLIAGGLCFGFLLYFAEEGFAKDFGPKSAYSSWRITAAAPIKSYRVAPLPMREATDLKTILATSWALVSWERAVHQKIARPKVYHGDAMRDCHAEDDAACAYSSGFIVIVKDLEVAALRAVLLHEIGHLLKVPHIEGDPLMEPSLEQNVDRPTAFAVALAKVANGWK